MYTRLRHLIPPLLTIIMVFSAFQAISSSAVAAQDTGTIRVLFRGCPDGAINPYTNSLDTCTTPLDAPDEAKAFWNVDGTGNHIMLATDTVREADGAYLVENVPAGAEVQLLGFHPTAHNNFEIIGGDDTIPPDTWTARVSMVGGVTRDVIAFYWNGEGGYSEESSSTLELTLRGCPDGVDPTTLDDPTTQCTTPLDAPDNSRLIWDMEGGASVPTAPRQNDGTYVIDGIPEFQHVGLAHFEPTVRDAYHMTGTDYMSESGYPVIRLAHGDERHVWVFYYNESGGGGDEGDATLDITLRGCPDGVDPTTSADPASECTTPLDAPADAGVIWGGDGQGGMPVIDLPRLNDGTYHLEPAPDSLTLDLANFEGTAHDYYVMFGVDGEDASGIPYLDLDPGENAHVFVYYYNDASGGDSLSVSYATINFTLRGCPDGVDPTTSADPYGECTVPLDAPEFAGVQWEAEGQGGIPLADVSRLNDGTYNVQYVAANVPLTLGGFEPTVRDSYVMFGIDGVNGDGIPFLDSVAPGETVQIHVFYYNQP